MLATGQLLNESPRESCMGPWSQLTSLSMILHCSMEPLGTSQYHDIAMEDLLRTVLNHSMSTGIAGMFLVSMG